MVIIKKLGLFMEVFYLFHCPMPLSQAVWRLDGGACEIIISE
jgi:hypothetical protein